ncbi:STAS domain-containing protein [Chondromyces apiculatus]|uniref:RsbR, positive regulator of sigma-B n=1 Tax=Chondromyces apiculatus DSM 436 TaxID=1192034 RepID=A0A017SXC8_9BACT|nr:STAS domain-containing protein [Chondromyces apiculatus]EYF01624.1 RsbR, positive regulator of sigma-B [Chondromyces apiculatus DSM 436]
MSDELLKQEISGLKARVAELEQLLARQDALSQQQSSKLEQAVAEAQARSEQLARSESELRRQADILRLVFDSMTDGVTVVNDRGEILLQNPAAERIFGEGMSPLGTAIVTGSTIFLPDGETELPEAAHPFARALRGEEVDQLEIFTRAPVHAPLRAENDPPSLRNAAPPNALGPQGDGVYLTVTANPMRGQDGAISGAVAVFRDAMDRRHLIDDLEAKNRAFAESEQVKTDLVERLRLAIDEISTPILELWDDVLALPLIGVVDSRRSMQIMERLLEEIVRRQSRHVIIDVTGVEIIDTRTADYFLKLIKAVALLGARCRITGVRPAVAQTLVELGIEFGGVRASRNLKHALRDILRDSLFVSTRALPSALKGTPFEEPAERRQSRFKNDHPRGAARDRSAHSEAPSSGPGQQRFLRKESSS